MTFQAQSKQASQLQLAYLYWLSSLGSPTHAVTITFKRFNQETQQLWSIPIIKKSSSIFLKILNKSVFGKSAKKDKACLMSAVVIGIGTYNDNPHAHLALEKPAHQTWAEFSELIAKAAKRTCWANDQLYIVPYDSQGWLEYMLEHGEEDLLTDLCTPARP